MGEEELAEMVQHTSTKNRNFQAHSKKMKLPQYLSSVAEALTAFMCILSSSKEVVANIMDRISLHGDQERD
ncbi:hypothetical protein RND71_039698 [Anisodus tanguticus]|uniref:Uncharacterized protein n=1 Tax=Anisodus tanguticus TaxID=243964 RepID=A0AAE1US85_9SOLA|nr:hypothetical protein RND71_039698 [Anisodus tanguticus]